MLCSWFRDSFVLAGVLLAFATIKPQLVLLVVAWLVLWACGNYSARKRFLWSFGLTMTILFAAAEFVMPGWLGQFVKAMAAYREYTGRPVSILAVLTTPVLGLLLSALMLLLLAVVCWRARQACARRSDFCSRVRLGSRRNGRRHPHDFTLQPDTVAPGRLADRSPCPISMEQRSAHSAALRDLQVR